MDVIAKALARLLLQRRRQTMSALVQLSMEQALLANVQYLKIIKDAGACRPCACVT